MFEYFMGDEMFAGLRSLAACVKHGKPAFMIDHGMTHFQYMSDIDNCPYSPDKMYEGASKHKIGSDERRRELSDVYQKAMASDFNESDKIHNVLNTFPWSQCKTIVDIGGCTGEFLASILKLPGCENIQGYVLELPDVVDEAKGKIDALST